MNRLSDRLTPVQRSELYSSIFRNHLEYFLEGMRNNDTRVEVPLNAALANQYSNRFYSLLKHLKVPNELHYLVLRLNNMTSPFDYTEDMQMLLLPEERVLNKLLDLLRTTHSIN